MLCIVNISEAKPRFCEPATRGVASLNPLEGAKRSFKAFFFAMLIILIKRSKRSA